MAPVGETQIEDSEVDRLATLYYDRGQAGERPESSPIKPTCLEDMYMEAPNGTPKDCHKFPHPPTL